MIEDRTALSLAGKVALVTGGSSGIGAACARVLAIEGATVAVGYHAGLERAQAVRESLPGLGHSTIQVSLESSDDHAQLAGQLHQQHGRVDILVNCAGYTQRVGHGDLETMTPALFGKMLDANARGPFSVTRALLPMLAEGGDGLVVSVSSVSAFTGAGSNLGYCAAKAALDTLTMSLARAFGPKVRFLCVSPASVDTGFVEGRTREELESKAKQTPLGRVVTPEDVARAVLACATHLTTATGTRLIVDGGHTL